MQDDDMDEGPEPAPRPLTLRQKQSVFAVHIARLILFAESTGHHITMGEGWRSDEEALRLSILGKGEEKSLHRLRLAQDLNLFSKSGIWLTRTEDHRFLAEWWLQQHVLARWGGNFQHRKDGNHYSFTHEGRE